MRWFVVCCVLVGCGEDTPSPPFTFRLQQLTATFERQTVLQLDFENYNAAIGTGPYTVSLLNDSGMSVDVTSDIELCGESIFACIGPVTLEELIISVDSTDEDKFVGSTCEGLTGSRRETTAS